MNCFLKPFVEDMNRLSSAGFAWTNPSGYTRHTRVFPGPCSVDTVARAMVMNMTQFNGAHGCACCERMGVRHVVLLHPASNTACMVPRSGQVAGLRRQSKPRGPEARQSSSMVGRSCGLVAG
ncbi:hypothetical protein HPB47_004150 [Ixodes persulcatus]|uniref:Uncharacterized protein n=1 Tax=Ixodes persulcatus TaxID=34615 RepID=A0AC60PGH5_IXOPE|nr:hypothetical protein HPB47_004150 [Ixodes persulcatus]